MERKGERNTAVQEERKTEILQYRKKERQKSYSKNERKTRKYCSKERQRKE